MFNTDKNNQLHKYKAWSNWLDFALCKKGHFLQKDRKKKGYSCVGNVVLLKKQTTPRTGRIRMQKKKKKYNIRELKESLTLLSNKRPQSS